MPKQKLNLLLVKREKAHKCYKNDLESYNLKVCVCVVWDYTFEIFKKLIIQIFKDPYIIAKEFQ